MKRLICVLAVLAADNAAASDGMVFNALDRNDPLYAEYQRNLCAGTREALQRFSFDLYWLNTLDPHFGGKSPAQREAWIVDYVLTASLHDKARGDFDANCR